MTKMEAFWIGWLILSVLIAIIYGYYRLRRRGESWGEPTWDSGGFQYLMSKLFGEEPEVPEEPWKPPERRPEDLARSRVELGRARATRGTSQFTGPGIKKLQRHRAGRHFERSMGVDHGLTMREVEEGDPPPRTRKRRKWAQ